jgi:hypothetical protein
MAATFMNSAVVLSIGIFFSLMIVGLSGGLHQSLYNGLTSHGVSASVAKQASSLPPVATLFAAFLGYNPIKTLLGPHLHAVSAHQQHVLLGHTFFPSVISGPFASALTSAFTFGLVACVIAALASLVPAKGQPWFGRGSGEPVDEHAADSLMVIPAGATLEYAGADVEPPDGR